MVVFSGNLVVRVNSNLIMKVNIWRVWSKVFLLAPFLFFWLKRVLLEVLSRILFLG